MQSQGVPGPASAGPASCWRATPTSPPASPGRRPALLTQGPRRPRRRGPARPPRQVGPGITGGGARGLRGEPGFASPPRPPTHPQDSPRGWRALFPIPPKGTRGAGPKFHADFRGRGVAPALLQGRPCPRRPWTAQWPPQGLAPSEPATTRELSCRSTVVDVQVSGTRLPGPRPRRSARNLGPAPVRSGTALACGPTRGWSLRVPSLTCTLGPLQPRDATVLALGADTLSGQPR